VNPGKPAVELTTAAAVAFLTAVVTLAAGLTAWTWTAEWRYAATALLLAFIALCIGAWFSGRKS
jgi:hypothetical protein